MGNTADNAGGRRASAAVLEPNTNPREAVLEHLDRNLQVVACAGSGKTEAISGRVVEILQAPEVLPGHVVAFTFTERAAAELKERIGNKYAEATGNREGLADLYVGTIHAFCLQLIQSHEFRYLPYSVLTDVQQRLFISRNSNRSGLTDFRTSQGRPWHRYHQAGTFAEVMSILREADIDPDVLAGSIAQCVLAKYETLLGEHKYFDYTSILSAAVRLIEKDEGFRERITRRVRYVVVDEYQDVNPIQERLIAALNGLGAHVTVVGDDDQLLYAWRGSRMESMLEFGDRYDEVLTFSLEENFRSSRGIVDLAAHVIRNNVRHQEKTMVSAGNQDFEQGDIEIRDFPIDTDEADYIASEIKTLVGTPFTDRPKRIAPRGLTFGDMAILVRVKKLIPKIAETLDARGIPYVVGGVSSLFDTTEAEATRTLFFFLGDHGPSLDDLRAAWNDTDLGIASNDLESALAYARDTRSEIEAGDQRFGYYNLQRAYLNFLEKLGIREENIDGSGRHGHTRAEIVYYNLGKFSQIISDYEQIYFHSDPVEKYKSFADFLEYQAEGIYPEGWLEARYVMPDAVQIMTIHQAKGLQWPVVFVPGLTKQRFPAPKPGGINAWSVIPEGAVRNRADYESTDEDERRLFYVACTRAKKFLRITRAVYPTEKRAWRTPSFLWDEANDANAEIDPPAPKVKSKKIHPEPDRTLADVVLTFSELKYAFECPYSFKLRFMYGFNPPIHEALGQGKGLHGCLFELHDRAMNGGVTDPSCVPELVERHLHLPFAYPQLKENLVKSAEKAIRRYIKKRVDTFDSIEHAEKAVEIDAGDNIRVNGRIDLIRRKDSDEVVIIDFKSNDRTQSEELSQLQLDVYALGYRQASGETADSVVVTNLDDLDNDKVSPVNQAVLDNARQEVHRIGLFLRNADFPKDPRGDTTTAQLDTCGRCDLLGLCRDPV